MIKKQWINQEPGTSQHVCCLQPRKSLHYHCVITFDINDFVAAFPMPSNINELHTMQNMLHVVVYSSQRKRFEFHYIIWLHLYLFCLLNMTWTSLHILHEWHKFKIANKISWFTKSETFAKLQKIPPTCIFWFIDWMHSLLVWRQPFQ